MSSSEKKSGTNMDRRRFLKSVAATGAMAGRFGVPVVFAASDDKGVAEARAFFGDIETVATKQALGWNAAISKHPIRAANEIYDGVRRAVARMDETRPFTFETPLIFEIRFKRLEAAQAAIGIMACDDRANLAAWVGAGITKQCPVLVTPAIGCVCANVESAPVIRTGCTSLEVMLACHRRSRHGEASGDGRACEIEKSHRFLFPSYETERHVVCGAS